MIYYLDKDESTKEDGFGFPVGCEAHCFVNSSFVFLHPQFESFTLKIPFVQEVPALDLLSKQHFRSWLFPEVETDEQQLACVLESAQERGRPICLNCSFITGGQR